MIATSESRQVEIELALTVTSFISYDDPLALLALTKKCASCSGEFRKINAK